MQSLDILLQLLEIPSPTYGEAEKTDAIQAFMSTHLPEYTQIRHGNGLIAQYKNPGKPVLAFVGHTDTVPPFFKPHQQDGKVFGSGASDMQAGIASMLSVLIQQHAALTTQYELCVVIYDKEEGTALEDNGLYALMQQEAALFKAINVAIVAEPTNNTLQLGCVGSLHYTLTVNGQAAHSARPWDGDHALYKALPVIQHLAGIAPKPQEVFGVTFHDVVDITESQSQTGRTTVPGTWTANINYRFSPVHTMAQAKAYVESTVQACGLNDYDLTLLNAVDAGQVVMHPLLQTWMDMPNINVEAKQAWTDVAQLTALGIAAVNFGPGLTSQAHQTNEYVVHADMLAYEQALKNMLLL